MRDPIIPASPFGALALLATARAAFTAARRIGDRRAGRDASEQEDAPTARRDLAELTDRLAAHAVRLRVRAVAPLPESTPGLPPRRRGAALALAFDDHVLLSDLAETAGLAHQKLLSLFPTVGEDVAEAARRLARDAEDLAGSDAVDLAPGALAAPTAALVDALRDVFG